MSTFWSLWITILTVTNLVLLLWILFANRKRAVVGEENTEAKTTGHEYDGIEEYDNPLPRWWFFMFLLTFVFGAAYLIIYPGLGAYKGIEWKDTGAWTSVGELRGDQAEAEKIYAETYGVYSKMPIEDLARNSDALKMGFRLFVNNCAVCHGSDGGGNPGFPNLTDKDWLYGGTPEKILETITHGRKAAMPAWGALLGEQGIADTAEYVLSLSGADHDAAKAAVGKKHFDTNCVACHGVDGKGNQLVGAPNLTDDIWLYGGEPATIRQTLRHGRNGVMPAQKDLLKEDRIHLLAAYVYSLSLDDNN
ncbi:cytochrome-c oxidase, cbb3-type subunit III [Cellvibrio mixtus]|uniref:Cbb3-type cytochrome c oxidase subunit n=1 Tax=Cellvibrio mixtus TaxID=39650 RepID=A0A266QA10_9GAMM|nr:MULTISPECIES: cytochrome-c oxidase, cbb3-type subunit III [Cellvibrio]AQT60138.1 cytochrome-c oxidase, cbb3-type subunit III [Cellvibrio sp. PSBB023]OZY86179.1 cytochrome-c oxidase, cbb3-type subunit III [Cellvibrio mixtus]